MRFTNSTWYWTAPWLTVSNFLATKLVTRCRPMSFMMVTTRPRRSRFLQMVLASSLP